MPPQRQPTPQPIPQREYAEELANLQNQQNKQAFAPVPWESWLRMFVSFVCGALTVAYFVSGKSRDIESLMRWQGEMTTWRTMIDKDGTNYARWNNDQHNKAIEALTARVATIEQHEEAHAVMRQKIERLEDDIKEIKGLRK